MSLFIVGPLEYRVTRVMRSPRNISELSVAVTRYVNKYKVTPVRVSFLVWAPDAKRLYSEALEAQLGNRSFLHVGAPLYVHDLLPIVNGRGALIVLGRDAPETGVALSR